MCEWEVGILDQLSELGLVFDEIALDGPVPFSLQTLRRIVNTVGVRVKRLRLLDPPAKRTYITLHAVALCETH